MSTAAEADFNQVPRPFKNPSFKSKSKKFKNSKALLAEEQRRLALIQSTFDKATYFSVEAPPSLKPRKWWCDITGLPGKYKTVHHGLRYYDKELFGFIQTLPQGVDQQYLELRSANVVLR